MGDDSGTKVEIKKVREAVTIVMMIFFFFLVIFLDDISLSNNC